MWLWFPEGQEGVVAQLRRGTLVKTDDRGSQQLLDVTGLKSEDLKEIVRVQPHGFTSHAPQKSEGVFLSLGGRSDRILALGFEHKDKRIRNLPEGAAVLYDDKGNVVYVKGSDGIAVHAKEGKVTVKPGDGQNVFLGGDGADGTYARVVTESGPSINVYAKV
ncbi:phage baseplate assembly protein [Xanthobacteraceae bacterium Astr-EGSB]|uniref:phage baseplate assembly protein domain-containing protein n=1 Tax=Astrobacterium formosum TaxID=3069710 RepID=UPI0027ADB14E|nr:phage baseplate assembly protein [Xanthobacteraceae bacterium Astr-EGSB]